MASTYTWDHAWSMVGRTIGRNVESDMAAQIVNLAINEIWQAYDFRETLTQFPPFYLVPKEQDHGAPISAVPSDFFGIRKAYVLQLTTTPVSTHRELIPVKDLRLTHVMRFPENIGYAPETASFRVWPRVPDGVGASEYLVVGDYKKRPVKVTAQTLASTNLPFDDIYLRVVLTALRWAAMDLAGDQRAGGVSVQGGQAVYTGERAKVQEALDGMAAAEGLNLGAPVIAPVRGLASSSVYPGSSWLGW